MVNQEGGGAGVDAPAREALGLTEFDQRTQPLDRDLLDAAVALEHLFVAVGQR